MYSYIASWLASYTFLLHTVSKSAVLSKDNIIIMNL